MAGPIEAFWRERVGVRRVDLPVDLRGSAIRSRRAIVKQSLVITIPGIRLMGESVSGVWCTLVMPVNLASVSRVRGSHSSITYQFDIFQLVALRRFDVFLLSDMRHITPIVGAVRSLCWCYGGIVKAIGTCAVDDEAEAVDVGQIWRMPAEINGAVRLCALGRSLKTQRPEEEQISKPDKHVVLPQLSEDVEGGQRVSDEACNSRI